MRQRAESTPFARPRRWAAAAAEVNWVSDLKREQVLARRRAQVPVHWSTYACAPAGERAAQPASQRQAAQGCFL